MINIEVEKLRQEFRTRVLDQDCHWRILYVARRRGVLADSASSLCRALRNLGHHVLELDFDRHADLVHEPSAGGTGAAGAYLRLDRVESLLHAFAPQIIVCCTDGATIRDEDAAELKGRGVVLIGITLGDPDALPVARSQACAFDLHTTNAAGCVPLYRAGGAENTFHFPFGIDSGFVAQEVTSTSDLEADIVCFGDGNAARNRVMARLAEHFKVRAHGTGWSLPDSEPLTGERRLQAARAALVHVFFSDTPTSDNLVGPEVFEAVGSGALLCAPRFPEMERLFAYGDEILGFQDAKDLLAGIRSVLVDRERYNAMTAGAMRRLLAEHLYEHRWTRLFAELLDAAAAASAWLGEARAGTILSTLEASRPRAKQVIVSGYYGAGNAGDEMILQSLIEAIEAGDSAAQVSVAAESPETAERLHGRQSFNRKSLAESLQAARTASTVVLGGGGLWQDYAFDATGGLASLFEAPKRSVSGTAVLPLMARIFGAGFHVAGLGVGPLENQDARRLARFLCDQADSILVRDGDSRALLMASGVPGDRIQAAPDPVYALSLSPPPPPVEIEAFREAGYVVLGVNLRTWNRPEAQGLVEAIAGALRTIAREQPLAIVAIPMQYAKAGDQEVLRVLGSTLGEDIPCFLPRIQPADSALAGTIAALDGMLCMRLHAALLAHRLRRPVVGLSYDPKVRRHFEELGRGDRCLELPVAEAALVDALRSLMLEKGRLPDEVGARVAACEREAAKALARLSRTLAMVPDRRALFGVPQQPLASRARGASQTAAPQKRAVAAVSARFVAITASAGGGVAVPENARFGRGNALTAWLATPQPQPGDVMSVTAEIELAAADYSGEIEVELELRSAYVNPDVVGKLEYALSAGGRTLVEELSLTDEPLRVRLLTEIRMQARVELIVRAREQCFHSAAWPRASRVTLALLGARPSTHGQPLSLIADRGRLV